MPSYSILMYILISTVTTLLSVSNRGSKSPTVQVQGNGQEKLATNERREYDNWTEVSKSYSMCEAVRGFKCLKVRARTWRDGMVEAKHEYSITAGLQGWVEQHFTNTTFLLSLSIVNQFCTIKLR